MKKLLTATTALALVGGAAFAEITISGSAELAMDYNSEPGPNMSKHSFNHDFNVSFAGSGTTDGGLSFGGSATIDNESGGGSSLSEGTVFVGSEFGKVTFGDNSSADKLSGGIADVGLNDVGVDDVAEDIYGTTANQVRYDHSVGSITLAVSAGTGPAAPGAANAAGTDDTDWATTAGTDMAKKNGYAIGMSFSASGATVGLGYDSKKTISAGFGYTTGQISANAFYAKGNKSYKHLGSDGAVSAATVTTIAADGMFDAGMTGIGMDVTYTMGASALTLAYAKTDVSNIQPMWDLGDDGSIGGTGTSADSMTFGSASFKGMGVGFSHDLGGGAKLVAGFAQVPQNAVGDLGVADLGQQWVANADDTGSILATERDVLTEDKNVASVGLSFSF